MKPGTKLKSTTCDTEIMVIKGKDIAIECGGQPMTDGDASNKGSIDPNFSEGTLVGKRYVDADGTVELLCVKAGAGSLSMDGIALTTKDAKPLPSSD